MKRAPATLNIKKSLKRKKEISKHYTQSENDQHRLETTNKKEKEKKKKAINKITRSGRSTFGSPFFNKI